MIVHVGHNPKDVSDYILWLAGRNAVTPMQLLKLVYICHGWMVGLHSRPLINEPVEAWQYGPVIPSIYHRFKKYGSSFIPDSPSRKPDGFDEVEENIMKQVWDHYGKFSGVQLSALTHQPGTPWAIAWNDRARGSVISNDLIEDHYRQLSAAQTQ